MIVSAAAERLLTSSGFPLGICKCNKVTLACEDKCADWAHPLISHSLCANYVSHMVTCMSIVQIGSQLRRIDDGAEESRLCSHFLAAILFCFLTSRHEVGFL